jgi:hypothetical protein
MTVSLQQGGDLPLLFGPYRRIDLLRDGPRGLAYRVQHQSSLDPSTLFLPRGASQAQLEHMRRRFYARRAFQHPNVARLLEEDLQGPTPWYSTDLHEKIPLSFALQGLIAPPPSPAPKPHPLSDTLESAAGPASLVDRGLLERDDKLPCGFVRLAASWVQGVVLARLGEAERRKMNLAAARWFGAVMQVWPQDRAALRTLAESAPVLSPRVGLLELGSAQGRQRPEALLEEARRMELPHTVAMALQQVGRQAGAKEAEGALREAELLLNRLRS